MAEILDDVAYLSQEIGPRPAGTEEEQQAALFIADQVHKRTNLEAEIEDIQCSANAGLVNIIYFGVAFLAIVFSLILPVTGLAMLIISILCTVCYLLEKRYNRPVLSRLFNRDASQNVVVKYRPEAAVRSGSRRKIIVVANYDSGRVRKDLKPGLLKAWSVLGHAAYIAMIAAPIVLFFKNLVFANALGFVSGFFSLLAIIAAVLLAVPVVREVVHRTGAYNEAANVNASSIAVLLNLMRRIGRNSGDAGVEQPVSDEREEQPVVHGYAAAEAAGVVPEGAELRYEDAGPERPESTPSAEPSSEEAHLAQESQADIDVASQTADTGKDESTDDSDAQQVQPSALQSDAKAADRTKVLRPEQQTDSGSNDQPVDVATDSADVVQEELPVQEIIEPEPAAAPADVRSHTDESAAERLRAAKAAIAALTGEPVDDRIYARDIADESVNVVPQPIDVPDERGQERMRADMMSALGGPHLEAVEGEREVDSAQPSPATPVQHNEPVRAVTAAPATRAATVAEPVSPQAPVSPESMDDEPVNKPQVPDWYRSAQEKARRSDKRVGAVHRSRYADALDSAVRESSVFFSEANKLVDEETESRLQNMRRGISEVRAPQLSNVEPDDRPVQSTPVETSDYDDKNGAAKPAESDTADARRGVNTSAIVYEAQSTATPASDGPQDASRVTVPSRKESAERVVSSSRRADEPVIPDVPQVIDAVPNSPEDADTHSRNKVLENDPSLGRTIAMKPIHMPTDNGKGNEAGREHHESPRREPRPLRPRVKLPEVPSANMAPITESAKQRAPLAQAAEIDGKTAAKSLLSHTIPKIDVNSLSGDLGKPASSEGTTENKRQNLLDHLPSLSGSIASETSKESGASDTVVSATGSFTAVSATGTFAPVGDELVADVDPEDRYVDDADDSVHAGGVTESGAFAGPDYVDMPKSRRSRFFSHFHRKGKKSEEEQTPQQWLDVEDDFDARTVGRERGDWDSFQEGDARAHAGDRQPYEESAPDAVFEGYEEYDANDGEIPNGMYQQGVIYESEVTYDNPISKPVDDQPSYSPDIIDEQPVDESSEPLTEDDDERRWQGGAFSNLRSKVQNRVSREGRGNATDHPEEDRVHEDETRAPSVQNHHEPAPNNRTTPFSDNILIDREIEDVYEFAEESLDTEVWFVALGAQEEGDNAGMKDFLTAHADELRGAYIVSLEGMGAGTLGFGNTEGVRKKHAPSTRLKRFLHTASQETGVKLVRSDQTWRESAASVAMDNGVQAVSLIGLDGDKPAFYAQSDDVLENIDEQQVRRNADYLWEFLKSF